MDKIWTSSLNFQTKNYFNKCFKQLKKKYAHYLWQIMNKKALIDAVSSIVNDRRFFIPCMKDLESKMQDVMQTI